VQEDERRRASLEILRLQKSHRPTFIGSGA